MSDAVLRAFELVGGIEAVRPDTAHLMGAIGAALTARLRANTLRKEGDAPKSSLVGAQELAALDPRRTACLLYTSSSVFPLQANVKWAGTAGLSWMRRRMLPCVGACSLWPRVSGTSTRRRRGPWLSLIHI